jgi:hypothetical protein
MVGIRLRNKETNRAKVHNIYTPSGFGWIDKVGCMGISTGNDGMFLGGNHGSKVVITCTENPRVGSSIPFFGMLRIRLGDIQFADFHISCRNLKKIGYPNFSAG